MLCGGLGIIRRYRHAISATLSRPEDPGADPKVSLSSSYPIP